MTQWIGGLGIVFVTIAVLPIFGVGSVQLFAAEATGPTHAVTWMGWAVPRSLATTGGIIVYFLFLQVLRLSLIHIYKIQIFAYIHFYSIIIRSFGIDIRIDKVCTSGYSISPVSYTHLDVYKRQIQY